MLGKLHSAFWKALTPDLIADEGSSETTTPPLLPPDVMNALGGEENMVSQQRVALTRVRVQLRDASRLDEQALTAAGVPAAMVLADGVVHVVTSIGAPLPE